MLLYQLLICAIHNTGTINLKYQLQCGMINLNYLMDYILDLILRILKKTSRKDRYSFNKNISK